MDQEPGGSDTMSDNKKAMALAMAERLEKLAEGLDRMGMKKEAELNRAKASEIREANK